ncbi:ABC transporter permease [Cuneatibacter sp. NSJ-177]|uniref:ABC transporter permease n=1 Tax=Cuneatibacter sp. NSJ-177 TaxID=2931401 RepID=UPI001FD07C4F|nr:ABC transporter permease [Cuneatibacter sp. NSJ-177]MCJ7836090.1 ABC transporter permease [Cuneatibacter sp. NSJ-177]
MENQISSIKKTSQFKEVTRRLFKNKLAIAGLVFIVLLIFIMIFADFLAPYGYAEQDFTATYQGPSAEHLLGTDHLGRDILSRLIYGSRISMEIAVLSVALSATIGITIGAIAGFYGGKIDNLLMRFLDIYQSIPVLILSIAIATSLGPGVTNTILALAISVCPSYARLMRASVMTVRDKEYIEAARSINANDARIILRHALPNAFSPMIVNITMTIGSSMLTAATLSFVGLGAQPPSPEWGAMLTAAKSYIRDYPYMITSPGVCIMLSVLSFNVLGDGLRDALDPRLKN